jgi:hypothetical protein
LGRDEVRFVDRVDLAVAGSEVDESPGRHRRSGENRVPGIVWKRRLNDALPDLAPTGQTVLSLSGAQAAIEPAYAIERAEQPSDVFLSGSDPCVDLAV